MIKKKFGLMTAALAMIALEEERGIVMGAEAPSYLKKIPEPEVSELMQFEETPIKKAYKNKSSMPVISIKRPEVPKPNGLKKWNIDGKEVWAINYKNAKRKAEKS